MNKFRCTYGKGQNDFLYYVSLLANSEQHAQELATGCVREKSVFSSNVDVREWSVKQRDNSHSGPARISAYGQQ